MGWGRGETRQIDGRRGKHELVGTVHVDISFLLSRKGEHGILREKIA